LQYLLGYSRYDKFKPIILKAKTACDTTGDQIEDHFLAMVRELLLKRGIVPENLPPAEDVKKLERRVKREQKQLFKDKDKLI